MNDEKENCGQLVGVGELLLDGAGEFAFGAKAFVECRYEDSLVGLGASVAKFRRACVLLDVVCEFVKQEAEKSKKMR